MLFLGGALLATAAFATWSSLANAINCGKCKRYVVDASSIKSALDSYHESNQAYPAGFDFEALRSALEPVHMRVVPSASDWPGCGLIRIKNGEWDVTPACVPY